MADLAAQQLQLHGREGADADLLHGDEAEPASESIACKAAQDRAAPVQEGRMPHEFDDDHPRIVGSDPALHDVGPLAFGKEGGHKRRAHLKPPVLLLCAGRQHEQQQDW